MTPHQACPTRPVLLRSPMARHGLAADNPDLRSGLPRRFSRGRRCGGAGGLMVRGGSSPASPAVVSIDPYAPFASLFLLAAMTWPMSERDRGYALAAWAADMQADIEADGDQRAEAEVAAALQAAAEKHGCTVDDILAQPEASELFTLARRNLTEQARADVHNAVFLPAGGWRAAADGPGLDVVSERLRRVARHEGQIAGRALCLTASMAHLHVDIPASMNRTWFLVQAKVASGGMGVTMDRASLVKLWREWGGVAPLHAAAHLWLAGARFAPDPRAEAAALFEPQGIGTVLGWAKWFRAWAVGYYAPRSKVPLIAASTAVTYETVVPELRPPLWPLTEQQVSTVHSYIAPNNNRD